MDLATKLDPQLAALLVVDMQNDFCADEGMMSRDGVDMSLVQSMAPRLASLISDARRSAVQVVFIRSIYSSEPNTYLSEAWFDMASRRRRGVAYVKEPVCAEGSWGADFYLDARPIDSEVVITKHRYSGFHNTDLESVLRSSGIRTIVLAGVSTNVCVESTARDGFMRDYFVVVASDAVAAYSQPDHDATLRTLTRCFGEVVPVEEIVAVWRER